MRMLIDFDSNVAFGPALGIKWLDRWHRAVELQIDPEPPIVIYNFLMENADKLGNEEYCYMEQYANSKLNF